MAGSLAAPLLNVLENQVRGRSERQLPVSKVSVCDWLVCIAVGLGKVENHGRRAWWRKAAHLRATGKQSGKEPGRKGPGRKPHPGACFLQLGPCFLMGPFTWWTFQWITPVDEIKPL